METFSTTVQEYVTFLTDNWMTLVGPAVVILVWLASGCVAGTIAELRRRSPALHFVIGLAVPLLYPAVILFAMSVKMEKVRKTKEDAVEHVDGPPPVERAPTPQAQAEVEMAEAEAVDGYGQRYFKDVALDSEGNPRGPFVLTVGGDEVRAERIVEAMPTVVVIEIVDPSNKPQKIRIPYDRIQECVEV